MLICFVSRPTAALVVFVFPPSGKLGGEVMRPIGNRLETKERGMIEDSKKDG
jgi:hypothetical protein